jgi:cytochrome oxidase Cu insertion factor (SCO1/SenC/PrrC family)
MTLPAHAIVEPFVPVQNVGDAIPDVSLVDEGGRRISLRSGARPTIVSFAYTRCPDPTMCSVVTAKFAVLQRSLRGSGMRLVEITLDPAYDRPAVLHRYAAAVGARPGRWSFATGRASDVIALAERFGIVFDRSHASAIRHTELVAIVSGDGTLLDRIDGARWSPSDVAAQARADAGLASNPLQRIALRLFASASAACGGGRSGGMTVLAMLALFIALTIVIAFTAVRLCAPPRLERSRH